MTEEPPRPRVHRRYTSSLYVLAWVLLVLVHLIYNPLWMLYEVLDQALLGVRFAAAGVLRPAEPVPEVVVITIDDRSLEEHAERWPWSRRTLARVVDRLAEAGVRVIGLDLFFAGPNEDDPEGDRILADAISRHGQVILATALQPTPDGFVVPLPYAPIHEASAGFGVPMQLVNTLGQATRFGVRIPTKDAVHLGFAVEVISAARADSSVHALIAYDPSIEEHGLILAAGREARAREVRIPLHSDGSLELDFRYLHAFPRVSAVDLLRGEVPRETLDGRIALVGVTSSELQDRFSTPVHEDVGGVLLHGTAISALLRGDAMSPPLPSNEAFMILAVGIVIGLLGLFDRPRYFVPLSLLTGVLWWIVSAWAFSFEGVMVPIARPSGLAIALTAAAVLRYRFRTLIEVTADDVLEGSPSRALSAQLSAAETRASALPRAGETAVSALPPGQTTSASAGTVARPGSGVAGELPGTKARETPILPPPDASTGGATGVREPERTGAETGAGTRPAVDQSTRAATVSRPASRRKNPVEVCHELIDRGDMDGAADAVAVMELEEHPVDGLYELGRRFEDRAALETAERLYESVYAREPQFRDVERRLAELREKLARFDEDDVARMLARRVLHTRFRDPELIARGGMGFVFRVIDSQRDDLKLALKVLSPFMANIPVIRERFLRESERLADLEHPHLIKIYDVFPANLPYYTMEFLSGRSLQQVLNKDGPLPFDKLIQVSVQALEALQVAHKAGIVHRDLKPDNLMVDDDWEVKVVDFGVARFTDADKLTRTGQIIGTLRFMSPEQLAGKEVDLRSDIYSMGVVIHELATGRLPFRLDANGFPRGEPDVERLAKKQPELAVALAGCFDRDPAERYGSAEELREVLARLG